MSLLITNLWIVVAKVFSNTYIFFCKNINVFAIFQDRYFYITLAKTSLSFEQLGPDDSYEMSSLIFPEKKKKKKKKKK